MHYEIETAKGTRKLHGCMADNAVHIARQVSRTDGMTELMEVDDAGHVRYVRKFLGGKDW